MHRPYFNSKINDLEALFDQSRSDRDMLEALLHELNARSVDRAKRLRERVIQALGTSDRQAIVTPENASILAPSLFDQVAVREVTSSDTEGAPASKTITASEGDRTQKVRADEPTTAPMTDLSRPRRVREGITYRNEPANILSAWTALEVLSPYTFLKPTDLVEGDERRLARLDQDIALPWSGSGEKARPKTQLFYHIILGAIRMDEATKALLAAFVDEQGDRRPAKGFAGIATVTLDRLGRPIPDNGVSVSSFAWGLPLALKRDLKRLGEWPDLAPKFSGLVNRMIRTQDSDGNLLPLDLDTIDTVHNALVNELGLPSDMVDAPGFALRHFHYWQAQEPPEPPLLGSFYLSDLATARSIVTNRGHQNLARYLGTEPPTKFADLIVDRSALAEVVTPSNTPLGRWPARGRHPLVLLQQAAVNLAANRDPSTAILPVNGPPGTGKTTLLRDLVASLVVKRAEAMSAFDDPEQAFTYTGEKRRAGSAFTHIYKPDLSLCGFEMLVASSNNRAVENVSRELPLLDAIAADATNLRYFKAISDNMSGKANTWGLIAAVLGNSDNRFKFKKAFWDDRDRGLRSYLSEASGSPQFIEEIDEKTGKVLRRRKPHIVLDERPPLSHEAALKEWRASRKAFRQAVADARAFTDLIKQALSEQGNISRRTAELSRVQQAQQTFATRLQEAEQIVARASTHFEAEKPLIERCRSQLNVHMQSAPGTFVRLFGSASAQAWKDKRILLERSLAEAVSRSDSRKEQWKAALEHVALIRHNLSNATQATEAAQAAILKAKDRIKALHDRCGGHVVDEAFLRLPHDKFHAASPWFDAEAHKQRDRVFETAMRVHKAFIGAAAKPIRNNLDALFRTFFGRAAWSPRMKPTMPLLWSTLFMVVPVISTTFASIERMLGFLPPEALGWLLIDEAGQAVPQSAVGALFRAKRAIIVGDPLQIEPVTSLPTELAEMICEDFKVDPNRWNAPVASVQTVADATSAVGADIPRDGSSIRVGVPLLVHRRCADPMFSLSNRIAYADLMVAATPSRSSDIRGVLGPSQWIDVVPNRTEDKWSEAEEQVVFDLIKRLGKAGVPNLDLYIVTPFVIVAQRLRERLAASLLLAPWTDRPWDWVRERVGTVHTVQGREADSVIFVLGAPLPSQRGARAWAGGSVNLLNVAATRAQENLYVVGSRQVWSDVGYFRELARAFPPE